MRFVRGLAVSWGMGLCMVAHCATVAGVTYPETQTLQNTTLRLNGAGVRYKTVFKVYTAGLYLVQTTKIEQQVLAQAGPKRFSVTMLRQVNAAELGRFFSQGMQEDRASFSRMMVDVSRMSQMFSDHKLLEAGENFTIDWLPGTGTVFSVKGVPQGQPFTNPEFFNAMLGIWLGQSPADWKLKEALLGKE